MEQKKEPLNQEYTIFVIAVTELKFNYTWILHFRKLVNCAATDKIYNSLSSINFFPLKFATTT